MSEKKIITPEAPELSPEETKHAFETLNKKNTALFSRVVRSNTDPAIPGQHIGLITFVPASGAVPSKDGIFGYCKLRGNFQTSDDASHHAKDLISKIDSYHPIMHTLVGGFFPLWDDTSKVPVDTEEINVLNKDIDETISNNIKKIKQTDEQQIREIREREKKLLEESRRDPKDIDPLEIYIETRVKYAQLCWGYNEHGKKRDEIKKVASKTLTEIQEFDNSNPSLSKQFLKKYMDARADAGIKETDSEGEKNFIAFLGDKQLNIDWESHE